VETEVGLVDETRLADEARPSPERVDVDFEDHGSLSPAWLIAIERHGRQARSEVFLSNGMDQQQADDKHHRAG
jgi:hypothetical protein